MDCSNFLNWNVRGLNDLARRDNVREVVDRTRSAMVCLQETKLATISDRVPCTTILFIYQLRTLVVVFWWLGVMEFS